jgi:hypothetical protein
VSLNKAHILAPLPVPGPAVSTAQAMEAGAAIVVVLIGMACLVLRQSARPASLSRYWLECSVFWGIAFALFGVIAMQSWRGAFVALVGPLAGTLQVARLHRFPTYGKAGERD